MNIFFLKNQYKLLNKLFSGRFFQEKIDESLIEFYEEEEEEEEEEVEKITYKEAELLKMYITIIPNGKI